MRQRLPVCLLLLLILALNLVIRWHLRNMPLERDEGEYAYAGQLILQGTTPYKLAFNMKFPGVYFMYAFLMAVFGQSCAGIHIGVILITSLTALLVFFIGRELLSEGGSLFATAMYVCLAALPKAAALAGHAAHFVSLFVCVGFFAVVLAQKRNFLFWWFASGTAFGMAILMKQNAALFPAFIISWNIGKAFLSKTLKGSARFVFVFCGGCILPFVVVAVGFAIAGVWDRFVFWTFDYARQYVSILPLGAAPGQFAVGFDPVFESGIWPWFAGVGGLFFLWRKGEWKGPAELAAVMFLGGMIATVPGFYFRNHYFLIAMPGLALLNAIFVMTVAKALKDSKMEVWSKWLPVCLAIFLLGDLFVNNFYEWFETAPVKLTRELYGNCPFPEAVPIAKYLKDHTSPSDTVAVIGSEPEIFFLSHRHSASGYIYLYSLTEPQRLAPRMGKEFTAQIEKARPKYAVYVNIASSWYSLVLPESLRFASAIQNWWASYSTNYVLVGSVKISMDAGRPSRFMWDGQLLTDSVSTNDDLLIYQRKP